MKTAGWIVLAVATTFAPAVDAQQQRMTPELLWKLGRVSAPRPSPDGRWVLYEVSRYELAENRGNADVYLVPAVGGEVRRITTHAKSDYGSQWSPDGRKIGFLSARDGSPQVYVIDVYGGEATKVTDQTGGVSNFAWSPKGDLISFTAMVQIDPLLKDRYPDLPFANARIIDDLMYRHWDHWYDGDYSHVMVQSVSGGEARDLMQGLRTNTPLVPFGGAEQIAWSPDGQEICYTAKIVEKPAESTDSDLYVVPVSGGAARCLTDGMDGFDMEPSYSPDGRYIAFHSMERAGFEADRIRLMLYDRSEGKTRELTSSAFDQSVGSMCWLPDGRSLVFSSVTKGTEQLYRIYLDGSIEKLSEGRHNLTAPAVSPDGKTVYALRSTTERPNEIVALPIEGGTFETITGVNDDVYATLELPTVKERWITSTDGAKVHCWVVYPPGFKPQRKYPMLTYCQGGPQSPISQWFSYRWNFHLMAAQGYIVLAVNRRGLPGFGQAWNDQISRDWGGQAMQDILSATDDMFLEPYVDREHTAAIGASFGGYTVYWLMGHDQKDRFATMIAHCGVFNLESMYGATEELWFPTWDIGGPYWRGSESREEYDRNSPHRFVQNWDTPLLVIHGQKDFRVPVTEGMQAFTAARLQGVPARFLYFPEEGHWVLSPQNGVLWHRVFFEWLDRWCRPK